MRAALTLLVCIAGLLAGPTIGSPRSTNWDVQEVPVTGPTRHLTADSAPTTTASTTTSTPLKAADKPKPKATAPVTTPEPTDPAPVKDASAAKVADPQTAAVKLPEQAAIDGTSKKQVPDSTAPTCTDGKQNGQETGVDCGGPACRAAGALCAVGVGCKADADCVAGATCTGKICTKAEPKAEEQQAPDGTETKTQTGTTSQPVQVDGQPEGNLKTTGADSGDTKLAATSATTAPTVTSDFTTCTGPTLALCDGVCQDVAESTSNCGWCGNKCPPQNVCRAGTCTTNASCKQNGVQDGKETDVDCGGSACPPCAVNKKCKATSDCAFGLTCWGGKCQSSTKDCTGQCGNGCGTGEECAARAGNINLGAGDCGCYCAPGFCFDSTHNKCQEAATSGYCNFNSLVWNGGTSGASYTCGSLQAGASDQCSSSEVCAQTDATTWQCLPKPGVGAPTGGDGCAGTKQSPGCPAGTFCWNGKCVCNSADPSSVTGSGPCPDGSFCTRSATASKDTSGNSYYTYRCCTDMARQCGGQCGPCPRNGFCSSTADCASGYYCEPATHQCTYYCSSGGSDSASGCPNNQVCDLRADNPDTSKQQSILCYCTRGQCLGSDGECYKDNAHCGYSGDWYPQYVCGSIANSQVDCTTLSGYTCTLSGGQYRCCNADKTNCV